MKRVFWLLCAGILLVCFLSGCEITIRTGSSDPDSGSLTDSSAPDSSAPDSSAPAGSGNGSEPGDRYSGLEALQKKINYYSKGAGVAFIGYVDSESSEVDLRAYYASSETGKAYPDLVHAPLYMAEGQELYAIIPPNDKGTIIVYPSTMTDDGEYADDKSNPLCIGEPGEALLLRCNLSEIYANVLIAVTDGGGALDFRPSLSMENGHLQEIAGVYDFSIHKETPDERSVQIATEILLEADEVKDAIEHGMKIMYTGDTQMIEGRTCLLFALGTDSEDQFVRERYYGVCDNLIYVYDAVSDTWAVLGRK